MYSELINRVDDYCINGQRNCWNECKSIWHDEMFGKISREKATEEFERVYLEICSEAFEMESEMLRAVMRGDYESEQEYNLLTDRQRQLEQSMFEMMDIVIDYKYR